MTEHFDHIYLRCTRNDEKGVECSGCQDTSLDCKYETLAICSVCGGAEGSLLPSCPGRWLSHEEHVANYQHYCNGSGPFATTCRFCDNETNGFDGRGPLCIDCAVVMALMKESQ